MLLKNGHLSISKNSIQTLNTCPFDSFYTIIAAMYADYEMIKNQIDQLEPNCKVSHMVTSMFDNEKRMAIKQNSLLRQRNEILKSIFEGTTRITQFESGLSSINCNANVNYLIPKALPLNLFSYLRKKQCSRCLDEIVSNRCFVDINIDQFEQESISKLNMCLLDTLISEKLSMCACGGEKKVTLTEFSNFIMVDLQLKHRIREASLNEIPRKLRILGINFTIFGCIEFIGDDTEVFDVNDAIGHYVSHIFRKNKRWERYDDLKSKITKSDTNAKIKAQVLFYVKEK